MLILSPIVLLLLAPLAMLALHQTRPKFKHDWLLSAGITLIAWLLVLLARIQLPLNVHLATWQPDILFPISPALLVDEVSWAVALALVTLLLASVLTDTGRSPGTQDVQPDWKTWSSSMAVTVIALVAVLAGNLLTLLLGWAAIDLAEFIFWLGRARNSRENEQVVLAFSARLAGLLVVIGAGMVAYASGSTLAFTTTNPEISIYLLIAAGLRLGVLPPSSPLPKEIPQHGGHVAIVRLAATAASLVLLVRTASVGAPAGLAPFLLTLAGMAALYGGLAWLSAKDEVAGQPYWLLGMAAITLAAASRAQIEASLVLSITTLLSGGLIFLSHSRHPRLLPLLALGLLGLSTLPYTTAWQGVRLYSPPFSPPLIIFPLGHALFLTGYIRHSFREGSSLSDAQRWVWLIYPWGLLLILVCQYGLGWLFLRQTPDMPTGPPGWQESWPALASLLLTGLIILIGRRSPQPAQGILKPFEGPMNWLYQFAWGLYYFVRRAFRLFSTLLEGRAGLLWTLLLLVLIFSILAQTQ